jgi:ubiquinone/menaquinone biosynthesis C-methylase UbiE
VITPEIIPFPFAFFYEKVVSRRVLAAQYKRIAAAVTLSKGFVIDIGTGPGDLAIEIASKNPEIRVLGIDASAAMIARARKKVFRVPNAGFRVMNARHLVLPDKCVDLVVSTASMHHWREPEQVFREIYRVLKPGGRALIYDLRCDAPRQEILAEIPQNLVFPPRFAIVRVLRVHGVTRKFLDAEILPLVEKTPFRESRVETTGWWYCLVLVRK